MMKRERVVEAVDGLDQEGRGTSRRALHIATRARMFLGGSHPGEELLSSIFVYLALIDPGLVPCATMPPNDI